jgi:hypothetical protein
MARTVFKNRKNPGTVVDSDGKMRTVPENQISVFYQFLLFFGLQILEPYVGVALKP